MDELTWLRSHVERCLQDIWDVPRAEVDDDGDFPFRYGTAACWVRVEPGEPAMVRVWANAALGVRRTAKLLAELNEVNGRSRTAHTFLSNGVVVVEQTLHAAGVDRATLSQACAAVGAVADDIGGLVAAVHGGWTPFPVESEPQDEEAC